MEDEWTSSIIPLHIDVLVKGNHAEFFQNNWMTFEYLRSQYISRFIVLTRTPIVVKKTRRLSNFIAGEPGIRKHLIFPIYTFLNGPYDYGWFWKDSPKLNLILQRLSQFCWKLYSSNLLWKQTNKYAIIPITCLAPGTSHFESIDLLLKTLVFNLDKSICRIARMEGLLKFSTI